MHSVDLLFPWISLTCYFVVIHASWSYNSEHWRIMSIRRFNPCHYYLPTCTYCTCLCALHAVSFIFGSQLHKVLCYTCFWVVQILSLNINLSDCQSNFATCTAMNDCDNHHFRHNSAYALGCWALMILCRLCSMVLPLFY